MGNVISIQKNKRVKEDFETVYKEYYSKVNSFYLSRVNNPKIAEDLTSEVFLYCFNHYDNYNPELASISTWIYLVTNSRWKNYCRDFRRSENIEDYENVFEDDSSGVEHAVWVEQLKGTLKTALENLTERQREIVICKYYKNMTAVEIARMLGTNDNNIRVQLNKALKIMKKYMQDYME